MKESTFVPAILSREEIQRIFDNAANDIVCQTMEIKPSLAFIFRIQKKNSLPKLSF